MERILLTSLFNLFAIIGHCQGSFTLLSDIGAQKVSVNGNTYLADSNGVEIASNYPAFDTLEFKADLPGSNSPIICNFKPDTTYSISVACCGSLDIIPASRFEHDSLKLWDYEKDFGKIRNQLRDKPFISIRTNKTPKDSVYAWHADAACETELKVIGTELWRLGVPPKCFYWNNITTVLFFKQDKRMPPHEETDLEEFLGIKNILELAKISFRLFDDERFILTFDETDNSVIIEYE